MLLHLLEFYGKITGMSSHLEKFLKLFKGTIRIFMEILKLIGITERQLDLKDLISNEQKVICVVGASKYTLDALGV